jgi:hypothetical protein
MWAKLKTWLWAACGNSRTILTAYAAELLGILDQAKLLDWSPLIGAEGAGKVASILGIVMFALRLITTGPASFKPQA